MDHGHHFFFLDSASASLLNARCSALRASARRSSAARASTIARCRAYSSVCLCASALITAVSLSTLARSCSTLARSYSALARSTLSANTPTTNSITGTGGGIATTPLRLDQSQPQRNAPFVQVRGPQKAQGPCSLGLLIDLLLGRFGGWIRCRAIVLSYVVTVPFMGWNMDFFLAFFRLCHVATSLWSHQNERPRLWPCLTPRTPGCILPCARSTWESSPWCESHKNSPAELWRGC